MTNKIAVLSGDGIGPEIVNEALKVLDKVKEIYNLEIECQEALIGGAAFDKFGTHFPDETKEICQNSEAILFGSVGGPVTEKQEPKWQNCEANSLLSLRKTFDLAINLRPVKIYPKLADLSPLRKDIIDKGFDILFVRELIGGIYFGEHKIHSNESPVRATDIAEYNVDQVSVAAKQAMISANLRQKKVTSVDKANVLSISKLWRETVSNIAKDYSDIKLDHLLVDNCAMQLILRPNEFDVIVTSNMFGDILSDLASAIPGSLGLMPSASLNSKGFGMYEPSGGSAPDIAGKDIANPIGQILSLALLFRYSLKHEKVALSIEKAVETVLNNGYATQDIYNKTRKLVGTTEMGSLIVDNLKLA